MIIGDNFAPSLAKKLLDGSEGNLGILFAFIFSLLYKFAPEILISFEELLKNRKFTEEVSRYLTGEAWDSVENAWELANKFKHKYLRPVHLLASIMATKEMKIIMARLAMMPDKLVTKIARLLNQEEIAAKQDPFISQEFKKVLRKSKKNYVYTTK